MRIDSHHHVWTYVPEQFAWIERSLPPLRRDFTAEEFERIAQNAGYGGSIAVQARTSLDETRFLLETARSRPFIRGVVGWADLRSPSLESQLDEFRGSPLVGIRHVVHDEPDGFLLQPEVLRGLEILERRGLAFDLLLFPRHLRTAAAAAARVPGLHFVLDHLGKPLETDTPLEVWRQDLAVLAEQPNVAVKVSGFFTEESPSRWEAPVIESLLETAFELFGPERLLASSNWPVSELAGPYAWAMGWIERHVEKFPEPIPRLVLGENAARVYGLDRR